MIIAVVSADDSLLFNARVAFLDQISKIFFKIC